MKLPEAKQVIGGVASPIPTGRKDCGGRRDRQKPNDPPAGLLPDTHGKERSWRERPYGGLRAFPVLGVSRHPEDDTALL